MCCVLVVDDEPDVRLLTRLMLEMAGHDVVECESGDCALQTLAGRDDIRTVLLDLGMPDVTGWDVIAELRNRAQLDQLRVIVFSAHIGPREYARAASEGAYGYLTKPFSEADLLAALN
jgi:CheY-like chemotaxis protein